MKADVSDPKTGKSYSADVPKDKESMLIGKKIGESVDGGIVGAAGYSLKITGGSDLSGVPMRPDVGGPRRARLLLSAGPGFRSTKKGERAKKTVRGNIISDEVMQVNFMVVEAGAKPLEELLPQKPKEKKDEKKK